MCHLNSAQFAQNYSITFDMKGELIVFKVLGIQEDGTEKDLGSLRYHVQLPQLFDQKLHMIELTENQIQLSVSV